MRSDIPVMSAPEDDGQRRDAAATVAAKFRHQDAKAGGQREAEREDRPTWQNQGRNA